MNIELYKRKKRERREQDNTYIICMRNTHIKKGEKKREQKKQKKTQNRYLYSTKNDLLYVTDFCYLFCFRFRFLYFVFFFSPLHVLSLLHFLLPSLFCYKTAIKHFPFFFLLSIFIATSLHPYSVWMPTGRILIRTRKEWSSGSG